MATEVRFWWDWDRFRFGDAYIIDPDGFRDRPPDTLYTKEEFLRVRQTSTLGFLPKSGMKSEDYARDYWEGGAGSEYHGYGDDPGWHPILDVIEKHVPLGTLLDIGCSKGYMVLHARERGWDARGIDISEYAVGAAPAIVAPYITRENVTALPFADEMFTVVHTGEFWEHMLPDELDRAMGEALRVLRPGGLFVNRIGIIVPENHPFRQPTAEDHSAHHTHFTVKTREQWNDYFDALELFHRFTIEDQLDARFADRDWVMRFFVREKP